MMRRFALTMAVVALCAPASAETVGTFTLDGLSFVSFGDREVLPLPAGSTLEFRFGETRPDGTTPFTIPAGGVSVGDVALPSGGVLRYSMAGPATGVMNTTTEGRQISFSASILATLDTGGPADGSYTYAIPFTTEATTARNAVGTRSLDVAGMRLVEGAWYGQIVGATTNETNAFPEPGAAVYTVLSGSFDRVP